MLTKEILSAKWQITTSLSNNKTDQYIVTAIELVKFVNKQRRIERRQKKEDNDSSPIKPAHPLIIWLIDLVLEKYSAYIERFKMKEVEIVNIRIRNVV